MVSVTHAVAAGIEQAPLDQMCEGLDAVSRRKIEEAVEVIRPLYRGRSLGTGEDVWQHVLGMSLIASALRLDLDTRLAALLFAVHDCLPDADEMLCARFGERVAALVAGLCRLNGLRVVTRAVVRSEAGGDMDPQEVMAQKEALRKMLLAMVEDIRVVLLRLASRTQTLRYLADHPLERRPEIARESLDIYAPLANRLGVWQLKWELEDLSFRFLEPETYKRIAKQLDERRIEREQFIADAIARLKREVNALGIDAEVYGRPKHIYSIWNKMRTKKLDFSQVFDVRALRVLVKEVKDCYAVLGMVHQIWTPIPKEFDDYISNPKGNNYRSLHTAVFAGDGRALEVQIRTYEMHNHAELGVAAHWRYKEGSGVGGGVYDDKIALLRQLLSWRDEITDSADWVSHFKRAALDDTLYVLTPQGRVLDLPRGATPIDFAYRVHTELGHRCRGAKVDGQLVPLNRPLQSGQRVEIVAAKQGGPSRDWLSTPGYLATHNARAKVKRWFALQDEQQTVAQGRDLVQREMQREGQTQTSLDDLAGKLGFGSAHAMFLAAGHGELGTRAIQTALREAPAEAAQEAIIQPRRSRAGDSSDRVLIVGVGRLLTQLGTCCKPAPPDAIGGFVTRGKGVSIHRLDCANFANMVFRNPERSVEVEWGGQAAPSGAAQSVYPVDVVVEAMDRQGLLRDISDVFSRERINVIAVNTLSKNGGARMQFTVEIAGVPQLQRTLNEIRGVTSVLEARRG